MSLLRIVLVSPRIASNVGNIARTCRALGAELHLVGPLGFVFDEKKAKRASVGYWEDLAPIMHIDAARFWSDFPRVPQTEFYHATKWAEGLYTDITYGNDCVLIFGNEEEGVSSEFWKTESLPVIKPCRIPMQQVRCLNLATSVGVLGYEVYRQWTSGAARTMSEGSNEDQVVTSLRL